MEVTICSDPLQASLQAAELVEALVRRKPQAVLGLASGSTPLLLYGELIRRHREEGLDFSGISTFNLDEYCGLSPDHPASYHVFMRENLFAHTNIRSDNIHFPDCSSQDIPSACLLYEELIGKLGRIDLQILGIGVNGHIGFNEPSSSLASRTRITTLSSQTRRDNRRFFKEEEEVPRQAVTMGVGTILEGRCCVLLAFGEEKAEAILATVEGPVRSTVPASALQLHPSVHLLLDEAAAGRLEQVAHYRRLDDG